MQSVEYLVVGAGVSGLSFANWARQETQARGQPAPDILILERDDAPGGYCKTVVQDGFIWDYAGHFFHFAHPEIEAWLRARMGGQEIRTVIKRAFIRFAGRDIDFPFQKNIHQLPRADFIDCLVDLYFRDEAAKTAAVAPGSFLEMLHQRFGKGIADRFLVPYNETLYACDLAELDRDAMGRFFPHADIADIIRNMRQPDNASYNSTFTYPAGGAIEYVRALLRDLPADLVSYGEPIVGVDLARRVARTPRREIAYRILVSSAPLPRLAALCGLTVEPGVFGWNKVLIFNLGFDRKGRTSAHWMYFPDRSRWFYRVGWYDNILDGDRMSLYVEVGLARSTPAPAAGRGLDAARDRVLDDLRAEGIVTDHRLVSWHSVVLDPAYVHITDRSLVETERLTAQLRGAGVHAVGRYGRWTYCSIEDNIVETRALARALAVARAPARGP
jgi:protoporphyrinogen oxidase